VEKLLKRLTGALQEELEQFKFLRNDMTLFSGERIGSFAGYTYYRFELPEDIFFRSIEHVTLTIGKQPSVTLPGNVITVENQFLTVALAKDFGVSLPEAICRWSMDNELQPILKSLREPREYTIITQLLFEPSDHRNIHRVPIEAKGFDTTPPDQLEAVKKIFKNHVTMLWGPIRSGKSHVLCLAAANYINAGRRVLFVAPSNDHVDHVLLKTASFCEQLGLDTKKLLARFDLPSVENLQQIDPYSLERTIESFKAQKREVFQERVGLLDLYWRATIAKILNAEFYKKIQEKRDHLAELRKQTENTSNEISSITHATAELESSSLMERLKKGVSKEDTTKLRQQLAAKQLLYKRLLSIQQGISNDITNLELDAPVKAGDMMEFKETLRRIDDLGGVDAITQSVEEFTAIDEHALFHSKLFVATSVATACTDPAICNQQFDLVIVDEAQRIHLPTLAVLSMFAKDKFVVAGDPFEVEPESESSTEQTQAWLQRDIFTFVAKTDELTRLFDWSQKNPQWSIHMRSHFATTVKLSAFMSSILFDNKINISVPPETRSKIYFIDTGDMHSHCKQYAGKKKLLPYNELHVRRTVECVKHALFQQQRSAIDIGVIVPFVSQSLFTKSQLRLHGIHNVEVGTPQSFCNRRKQAIIFDTTMAGVDYTIRQIDDKKIGEHRIARLFNTVLSCVGKDLYVIADMAYLKMLYTDRLFTRLLLLLQAEADIQQPDFQDAVRRFDNLDMLSKTALLDGKASPQQKKDIHPANGTGDAELDIKLRMMEKQQTAQPVTSNRNIERDNAVAVQRVLGLRTDVNLISEFIGGDILFRHTLATEEAIRRLPMDVCESEKDFSELMERWNLLIYETSGGDKTDLSYFAHKGPESRVRQDVRNLKTYYSSEVEAAIEDGKHKIAVEISRVFHDLLGKSQPGTPAEWTTAYLNFLGRVEAYLSWVSEQVRR
jgi:hypothetical protein